jgi:hypothetical protein
VDTAALTRTVRTVTRAFGSKNVDMLRPSDRAAVDGGTSWSRRTRQECHLLNSVIIEKSLCDHSKKVKFPPHARARHARQACGF